MDLADDLLLVPPNSSTTMARCVLRRCISVNKRETFITSGTKNGLRTYFVSWNSSGWIPFFTSASSVLAWRTPTISSRLPR